jgi:hypothetical protein
MSFTTNSTNMLLPIPTVGQEPGPEYAQDINNCLTIIDQHNHEPGSGVQITPAGLDINSDLTFGDNNAIDLRSARLSAQSAVLNGSSDLRCLYAVSNDLYFNDGLGNQVRITQSGAVAGTPGSISNLVSPASAAYVSGNQTFVFQSAANTPANIDGASFILRNLTASSFGLTLSPPNAMGSNYALTLPSLPAQTNFVTLSAAGTFAAAANVDNVTLQFVANTLAVKTNSLGTSYLIDHSVTKAKEYVMAAALDTGALGEFVYSASSGLFQTTGTGSFQVTNFEIDVVSQGAPVKIEVQSAGDTAQGSYLAHQNTTSNEGEIVLKRNGTIIYRYRVNSPTGGGISLPSSAISFIDRSAPAGTNTYTLFAEAGSGSTLQLINSILQAYEL